MDFVVFCRFDGASSSCKDISAVLKWLTNAAVSASGRFWILWEAIDSMRLADGFLLRLTDFVVAAEIDAFAFAFAFGWRVLEMTRGFWEIIERGVRGYWEEEEGEEVTDGEVIDLERDVISYRSCWIRGVDDFKNSDVTCGSINQQCQ